MSMNAEIIKSWNGLRTKRGRIFNTQKHLIFQIDDLFSEIGCTDALKLTECLQNLSITIVKIPFSILTEIIALYLDLVSIMALLYWWGLTSIPL